MTPRILDVTCGGRSIWHPENKDREDSLYADMRQRPGGFIDDDYDMNRNPGYAITPDVVQDFRQLPYKDESFDLAVFDPPHAIREGGMTRLTGITHRKWGALAAETWQADIEQGFTELWRVLKDGGTLIFKFADESAAFEDVLALAPEPPLFGTSVYSRQVETRWYVFHK